MSGTLRPFHVGRRGRGKPGRVKKKGAFCLNRAIDVRKFARNRRLKHAAVSLQRFVIVTVPLNSG
jgi:hypothetical protein